MKPVQIELPQNKIDEDSFLKSRLQILSQWPTGKDVDMDETVEYQRNLPKNKVWWKVIDELHREHKKTLFPRVGTPLLEEQIETCQALLKEDIKLIAIVQDSFTRNGQYKKAQEGLEKSIRTNHAELNGYPVVNLGIKHTRKISEACNCALNVRLPGKSAGLTAEIVIASGITGLGATSPFFYFGCYEKSTTLSECIRFSQYPWRLLGYLAERGVIITIDGQGWMPGFIFPEDIDIACMILYCLMAAEQGVKSVTPQVQVMGNLAQDIATVRVARKLIRHYLDKYGYEDVLFPGIMNSQLPLYPFPQDLARGFAFINYSTFLQSLAGSEVMWVRTTDEGAGIPTRESLLESNISAKWVIDTLEEQQIYLETKEIKIEEEITEKAIRAIVDRTIEMGNGNVVEGSIKAVESGVIDSPLGPNIHTKNKVMGIRDSRGACRYLDFGNLPLPEEVKEFHREKVLEREKIEGRKMDYKAAIEDLWAPSKGRLKGTSPACR